MIKLLGKAVIKTFDWLVQLYDNRMLYAIEDLNFDLNEILSHAPELAKEFVQVQQRVLGVATVFKEQEIIAADKSWKSYMLRMFGHELVSHTINCPITARLIDHPKVASAMFSVLKSGQSIKPHFGIYKGVLRVHLGLIIPEGECYMMLNGQELRWKTDEHLIFDDTFQHEVHNNTKEDRVILFLDVIRPLPFPLNRINQLLFFMMSKSSFIQNIFREIKRKEANVEVTSVDLDFT